MISNRELIEKLEEIDCTLPKEWWDESGTVHAKAETWTEENHSCVHPALIKNPIWSKAICDLRNLLGDVIYNLNWKAIEYLGKKLGSKEHIFESINEQRHDLILENLNLQKKIEDLRTQQINWVVQLCDLLDQMKDAKNSEPTDYAAGYSDAMEGAAKWLNFLLSKFKRSM